MFFGNLRIRPATWPVKLGNAGRAVDHANLPDAILVAVQRMQAAIAGKAYALQRIEYAVGCEVGKGDE